MSKRERSPSLARFASGPGFASGSRREEKRPARTSGEAPAAVAAKPPKYLIPEAYDGKEKGCRTVAWMTKMAIHIDNSGVNFPDNKSSLLWILSNMKGAADDWAQPLRMRILDDNLTGVTRNLSALTISFTAAFGDPDAGHATHRRIAELKQTNSATEYTTKFRTLAADLNWNESALMAQYKWGLLPKVDEVLSQRETQPTTLEGLISTTIRINNTHQENTIKYAAHKSSKSSSPTSSTNKPKGGQSTCVPLTESPNFIGKEEKDRCREAGLCVKCGKAGHGFKDCKMSQALDMGL